MGVCGTCEAGDSCSTCADSDFVAPLCTAKTCPNG